MKKIINLIIILTVAFFIIAPASAQLLDNADTATNFASEVRAEAGLSEVSLGYVIATLIKGFLGVLALTFVILMVLAGFRWMNSGGNEETIKKAQDTIKNALIGLVLVLAAWAITYFVFNMLPFGGSGGGLQGGTSG